MTKAEILQALHDLGECKYDIQLAAMVIQLRDNIKKDIEEESAVAPKESSVGKNGKSEALIWYEKFVKEWKNKDVEGQRKTIEMLESAGIFKESAPTTKESSVTSGWIKTKGPLSDGWYWYRGGDFDGDPEVFQVANGYIIDNDGSEMFEHTDYSGEWSGPIIPISPTGNKRGDHGNNGEAPEEKI